jgi:hypothetical protein
MDDLSWEIDARKSESYLPETQEEAEDLASLIEMAIDRDTGRGIRDLSVIVEAEDVFLGGICESFYDKQLAQHAAMHISGNRRLVNGIEVL